VTETVDLQVPLHRRGCGQRLLDAAVAHARSLRLEALRLSARLGTGLPEFYAARGWTEVGRWPGGVRLAPGDDRDEVLFQRVL
jgi:GNAT superfamily N-acetyltransferase